MRLSDQRARAVVAYLVNKGVKTALVPLGLGVTKPMADNGTREGREANRRVEFNILEQDITRKKVEIDKSGKEKVVEEKRETLGAKP
jgi:OOP family OmpA-OmpF porin